MRTASTASIFGLTMNGLAWPTGPQRALQRVREWRVGRIGHTAQRRALLALSHELVNVPVAPAIAGRVLSELRAALPIAGAALYLRDDGNGYVLHHAEGAIVAAPLLPAAAVEAGTLPLVATHARGATLPWLLRVGIEPVAVLAITPIPHRRLTASDSTLLGVIASQLAIALKNAEYVRHIQAQAEEIAEQKRAIEELHHRLHEENLFLRGEVSAATQFQGIIGSSRALQDVLRMVQKTARCEASVLITGETGTGKELIARAVHELSARRNGPFICINCPAIPPELAESELFGYERGAFTGATVARPGKFELADGGTVFLDEVADLPLAVQVKLLRALQEKETQRIGSRNPRKLNLRIIAATNRDLASDIRDQRFREDFYYRLATVVIDVPPLRQRVDDIPMLATFFLQRAAVAHQRPVKGFSAEALEALCNYSWPGNIRELQNVIERAVLLSASDVIRAEYLGDLAVSAASVHSPTFRAAIREEKRRRMEDALRASNGNQAAAARRLGISRSNFNRIMKNLGIKAPEPMQ